MAASIAALVATAAVSSEASLTLSLRDSRHKSVFDVIMRAMNGVDQAEELIPLFDDASQLCDPYPKCTSGLDNITALIAGLPRGTSARLAAEDMVTGGPVGGFMSTLSLSFPGEDSSCFYTDDQHISWRLREDDSDSPPKLDYLRFVYNATMKSESIHTCSGGHAPEPIDEAPLLAVRNYVSTLEHDPKLFHYICDLIAPNGRYCDPYPTRCAVGPKGCRSLFDDVTGKAVSFSRPASVRPMIPCSATTAAQYMHFSMIVKSNESVEHSLHQTFGLWTLAVSSSNATGPGPWLSSWDWFYMSSETSIV